MMTSSKKSFIAFLIMIPISIFVIGVLTRTLSIEGVTYPKATNDLSVIERWSEKEVYSFSNVLGCFDLPHNVDFENSFPEAVAFCRQLKLIWAEKYDRRKENNLNWELFNSLEE